MTDQSQVPETGATRAAGGVDVALDAGLDGLCWAAQATAELVGRAGGGPASHGSQDVEVRVVSALDGQELLILSPRLPLNRREVVCLIGLHLGFPRGSFRLIVGGRVWDQAAVPDELAVTSTVQLVRINARRGHVPRLVWEAALERLQHLSPNANLFSRFHPSLGEPANESFQRVRDLMTLVGYKCMARWLLLCLRVGELAGDLDDNDMLWPDLVMHLRRQLMADERFWDKLREMDNIFARACLLEVHDQGEVDLGEYFWRCEEIAIRPGWPLRRVWRRPTPTA